jgi:NADH-quinone oxidoreductase subunit H
MQRLLIETGLRARLLQRRTPGLALTCKRLLLRAVLCVLLFLGGWLSPIDSVLFTWIPGWIWLGLKTFVVVTIFLWVRSTFPRYRYDQIMRLGWKIFIPVTLVWLVVVGAWMQTSYNIWK